MMDLNLWTEDFFLPQDLGLDLLADQQDGQYDDLKEPGRLISDLKPTQHEDVVEQLSVLSSQSNGLLDDMDWMESDVSSLLLDALASQQQEELTFPPELFDKTSSLPTEIVSQTVFSDVLNTDMAFPANHDSNLTPPESPEQVIPEIVLEEPGQKRSDDLSPSASLISHFLLTGGEGLTQGDLHTDSNELKTELNVVNETDFIDSPLSADDVESMLSSPEPSSPSTSTLILSSPELYKVIAAPSNLSNRFSPYSKQKNAQKNKSAKSSRSRKVKIEVDLESDISFTGEDASNLNKKDRKRLQNKNAAIRYRQKKKEEAECISTEVEGLEDRNQELKTKVEDLEREIRYMKNLMQDIQKAKGIVSR